MNLFPVNNEAWERKQNSVSSELQFEDLWLSGDGSCESDWNLLHVKWIAIVQHTANIHLQGSLDLYQECPYPLIPREEARTKNGQFGNVITIPVCPVISPSRDSDDKESESDSDSDYEDEHSKEDGHDH
ncbi:unnamed protein product [Porites evermanni]|uniref:Uncharacterized protein n=1 Tax=Porites evermanni TaxID=104178 RepID=A0ABN8QBE7_9CNID|nr:unnamed protein product [Porites evermanni]